MITKKNIFSLVLLLFVFASTFSQVHTGNIRSNSYKKKDVERFKKARTTYFQFYEDFGFTKEEYEDVLAKSWKLTPYKVVDSTAFWNSQNGKDAFAHAYVFSVVSGRSVATFPVMDFYSVTERVKRNGKKKYGRKIIATIYFTLDISGRRNATDSPGAFEGDLLNYNLGYLKNMFQAINDLTEKGVEFSIKKDFKNKEKLKVLKSEPLYISSRFIYSYNPFKGKAKKKQITAEELFKS